MLVSAVEHIAQIAPVYSHSLLDKFLVCIQELPSIILRLVCYLRLPWMNLPGPMFRVWLKRRNFIVIVMSSHRHLNETLFNVLFTTISLSLHIVLMHSRASSRIAAIISCIEAVAGTTFFSVLTSVIREIISFIYSLSIIEISFNGGQKPTVEGTRTSCLPGLISEDTSHRLA